MTAEHAPSYRVLVTDHITDQLAGGQGRRYERPPRSEAQARCLLGLLLGRSQPAPRGPWRQAIAGGQRVIELRLQP